MIDRRVPHSPQQGFSLHPTIDREALRHEFAQTGRVQIAPFIGADGADLLRENLLNREDWWLAVKTSAKKQVWFDRSGWKAMSAAHREAVRTLAAPNDRTGFRYMFEEIVVVGQDLKNREIATVLGQFARFMSSASVVEAVRTISGAKDVSAADARASCYGQGHFLTVHDDRIADTHRRVAYVFGLTAEWRSEWGGLLLFHNKRDDVELGLLPRMNSLNLFAVPQEHSVSLVSPFAPVSRYSVSGWFRATADASLSSGNSPSSST